MIGVHIDYFIVKDDGTDLTADEVVDALMELVEKNRWSIGGGATEEETE